MNQENKKALWKLFPAVMVIGAMVVSGASANYTDASNSQSDMQILTADEIGTMLDYLNSDGSTAGKNKSSNIKTSSSSRSLPSASSAGGGSTGSGSTYTPRVEIPSSGYQDGTYTGSGTGFGGTISVSVTISGGKITAINVLDASSETASYFASAKSVLSQIISTQNPNVDAVSGATYSSNGLIQAVQNALSKAASGGTSASEKDDSSPSPTARPTPVPTKKPSVTPDPDQEEPDGYQDGIYTGTGTGFSGEVKLTAVIEKGVITKLTAEHTDTADFFKKAWNTLQPEILKQQSAQGIDSVSGATYSSRGILEAMEDIVRQAAYYATPTPEPTLTPEPSETLPDGSENPDSSEDPEITPTPEETPGTDETPDSEITPGLTPDPEITPELTPEPETTPEPEPESPYLDGTYTGSAWGYMGKVNVTVTISDGKITSVTQTNKDTAEYFNSAWNTILPQVMNQQSADGIDAVSGATFSSEGILDSLKAALNKAKR